MNILSHHPLRLALLATLIAAPSAAFAIFTGPTGAYYLDNYSNSTIYVVQGNAVINSFATSYATAGGASNQEGSLAVTNVVTTTGFGSFYGSPSSGGQYTLAGVPTGSSNVQQPTPGFSGEIYYDGTSNGQHNYTVQYQAVDNSGNYQENVIQTDLNWQNPIALFAVEAQGAAGLDLGISYDSLNNSLWVSRGGSTIRDFSMTGTLLSSFSTPYFFMTALAFDNLDNTLWFSYAATNTLVQYDTNGNFLQSGIPTGLPNNYYLAGEFSTTGIPIPEPAITSLLALGLAALALASRRRSTIT
jgi:hypothetical protein